MNKERAIWLEYGLTAAGELVHIGDAGRGKTDLHCPYCNDLLLAKKGPVLAAHFAHAGKTCDVVRKGKVPTLPLYDRFNLKLTAEEVEQLRRYWAEYGAKGWGIPADGWAYKLADRGFLEWNFFHQRGLYDFTKLGKIPIGELSLRLFCQVQEPMLLEQLGVHTNYEAWIRTDALPRRLKTEQDLRLAQADVRLYRAQLRRVLASTLYFLKVTPAGVDQPVLHKVGVTTRPMEERLAEIRADLRPHLGDVGLQVLGTWPHRGNVELYFKYRFARWQHPLGALTEYFCFADVRPVITDLRRMTAKELNPVEQEILTGVEMTMSR